MNPEEASAKIAATVQQQRTEDALGEKAIMAALPGPVAVAFNQRPEIEVGPYKVRRLVSRDFVRLAALGHPLNSLDAIQDAKDFTPDGQNCWILCWLMTRPVVEVKKAMESSTVEQIKAGIADEFGELTIEELSALMIAIAKNLALIDSSKVELIAKGEGENSSPPPSSQA